MYLGTYFLNLSLVGQNWYVGKFQWNPWSKQSEEEKPADNTLLLQVDIFSAETTAGHHILYCLYSAPKANYTFQKWSQIAQVTTIPGLVRKCAVLSAHGSYQGWTMCSLLTNYFRAHLKAETTSSRRLHACLDMVCTECDCCIHTCPNELYQEGKNCVIQSN